MNIMRALLVSLVCAAIGLPVLTMAQAPTAPPASTQQSAPATTPAPAATPPRPVPPTRDPHTPGYVTATELPDGTLPPPDVDGNFIVGPTHAPAPGRSRPKAFRPARSAT
jgi:hypothetical protein